MRNPIEQLSNNKPLSLCYDRWRWNCIAIDSPKYNDTFPKDVRWKEGSAPRHWITIVGSPCIPSTTLINTSHALEVQLMSSEAGQPNCNQVMWGSIHCYDGTSRERLHSDKQWGSRTLILFPPESISSVYSPMPDNTGLDRDGVLKE